MTRVSLAAMVALGAAAVAATWWVIGTEPGTRWSFERLGAAFPGRIEVGRIRGPIRGPLEVRDFRYHDERVDISVDRLALVWNLQRLPWKRLDIAALDADSVKVVLYPPTRPVVRDTLAPALPDINLPLDVMMGRARIRDLHVTPAGSDSAWVIDELALERVAFRDTLGVGRMTVRGPRFDLEVQGRTRPRGRYDMDLGVRWTFHRADGRDLVSSGRLLGGIDTLVIVQDITAPFRAHVDLTAYQPIQRLRFTGVVSFSDLDPQWFGPAWPESRARGRFEVSGRSAAFEGRGIVDAATTAFGPLHAVVALDKQEERLRLHQVTITRPDHPMRVVGSGTIVTVGEAPPRLDLAGSWTEMGLPLRSAEQLRSERGTFRLVGTAARYRVETDAVVSIRELPASRWRLAGTGDPEQVVFPSVDGEFLGGRVTGRGTVGWKSSFGWRTTLAARGLNPAVAWPRWPGSLDFDLASQGHANAAGARGDVAVDGLAGTLRGHAIAGHGAGEVFPDGVTLSSLDLGWGPNHATATGPARQGWDLTWTVNARDLSVVLPEAAGSLDASGRITGTRLHPHVQGTLDADSLRWRSRTLDRMTADADLDFARRQPSRLDLVASGLHLPRRTIDQVRVQAAGPLDDHSLAIAVASEVDSLQARGQGRLAGGTWSGGLRQFDLVSHDFGSWALVDTGTTVTASAAAVAVNDFCWRSGAAQVCADADWRNDGAWGLKAQVDQLLMSVFNPRLPPGLELTGPLNGTVDLHGGPGTLRGDANLEIGPGEMSYPLAESKRGSTPLSGTIRARSAGDATDTEVALSLGPAGTVRGNARIAATVPPRPVSGNLEVRLADLAFVQGLVTELSNTQGRFTADLRLDGGGGRARWIGEARLENAQADLSRVGVELREIGLTARSDAAGRLMLEGGARSGEGRLKLDGEAMLAARGTPTARATITGRRIQAANTKDMSVVLSPDLSMAMVGDSVRLTGEIMVHEAELTRAPRRVVTIPPSGDVVYVRGDSAQEAPHRTLAISSEVRVSLSRNVHIQALGLDARAEGSILAIDEPDRPAVATGELHVTQGTYRAYGQNLQIERGRLIYGGGPIRNPDLDVRASRRANDGVVAGFEIHGNLEAPRLSVFSDPPMAERDALAYVVFGRPFERGNRSEAGIVDDAATALGLRSGSYLAGTLARDIGVEEAMIESEGGFEEASLMLGKYLSPRLYVNYGIGIMDAASRLRIQYFLNRRWTLQAEAGSENNASILYTVER